MPEPGSWQLHRVKPASQTVLHLTLWNLLRVGLRKTKEM